jgi:nicotinic acid mononucleotide adenylyltransferase
LENIAALYLAHLNPVTNAHEKIISQLAEHYHVYVFPVVFLKEGREINTRTFPFPYELRRKMLLSLFDGHDNIDILPNYNFVSPYIKYLPPILSPYSWSMRREILRDVLEDRFISYTGDSAERIALRFYNLHPIKAKRLEISSSNVKELLYREALENLGNDEFNKNFKNGFDHSDRYNNRNYYKGEDIEDALKESWQKMVPKTIINIICENWAIVEKFAQSVDKTIKIFGMKFPTEGILN